MRERIIEIEAIKRLLPHREPMVLVDGLIYFDGILAISTLTVLERNIFVGEIELSETGLIEHMAQSAALMTGYKYQIENLPIREGFIASIKNLNIITLPKVNNTIQTETKIVYEVGNLSLVNIESKLENNIIASAEMTLTLKENP